MSPSRGDTIVLADYSGTFSTNKVIIDVQGQLLDSTAGQYFKLETNNKLLVLFILILLKLHWLAYKNSGVTSPSSAVGSDGVYLLIQHLRLLRVVRLQHLEILKFIHLQVMVVLLHQQ